MSDQNIVLPSKPKVIKEEKFVGVYEIDGLYPGYGHTLGNSLRRIILSSLHGSSITSVKIDGVSHEFSTMEGVKEDVIAIILNLKKVRVKLLGNGPVLLKINKKEAGTVVAADINVPGQAEILNLDQHILTVTDKNISVSIELEVNTGLGYVPKEVIQKDKVEIGTIALDAVFTPIRRVNYEVENMRVGDRTDFNKLRMFIETDGTLTPREALEKSIEIMICQLKAIVGFKEEDITSSKNPPAESEPIAETQNEENQSEDKEFLKTRIEDLNFSSRTQNALSAANVRTVGGLARKKEEDILDIDGLGSKGIQEIKRALSNFGITLK